MGGGKGRGLATAVVAGVSIVLTDLHSCLVTLVIGV